jgi:putative AlgH/UPF0301 family transcriptional regulator
LIPGHDYRCHLIIKNSGLSPIIQRIFSGYAGWKPGQLEAEVKQGYWLLREADTEILFNTEPDLIWRKLLASPGKGYLVNLGKRGKKGTLPLLSHLIPHQR